jgi:hypothetical protein
MDIDRRKAIGAPFALAAMAGAGALQISSPATRTLEELFPIPLGAGLGHWTMARLLHMRLLCAQGLSTARIARQLGAVTRNAVIGKLHRLNWGASYRFFLPAQRPRRVRVARADLSTRR